MEKTVNSFENASSKTGDFRSRNRALAVSLILVVLTLVFYYSPLSEPIENVLSRRLEFHLRHALGKDPVLDPRIRILTFGDATLQYVGEDDLTLDGWAKVVKRLSLSKPSVVLFDRIFGTPRGRRDAKAFVSELKKMPFPVIAGAFVAPTAISFRPLLPTYSFNNLIPEEAKNKVEAHATFGREAWERVPVEPGHAYGPHPDIREAFKFVGHLMYNGNYFINPLIRLGRDQILPHQAFFATEKRNLAQGRIMLEDVEVPLDNRRRVLINFAPPSSYLNRTIPISALIDAKHEPLDLPKDAVIVVLPAMFTGNTEMQLSPFGQIPGGFLVTALVNSVITQQWIRFLPFPWLSILLMGLFGWLGAIFFIGSLLWLTLILGATVPFAAGIASFSYLQLELPWLCGTFAFLSCFVLSKLALGDTLQMTIPLLKEMVTNWIDSPGLISGGNANAADFQSPHSFRFGEYQLIELLGHGGMGEVYRAKAMGAAGFEKEYAIKKILPQYAEDPKLLQKFHEEARLNSSLAHPNIAQVYQFLHINKAYLLIMEYIDGVTLAVLADKGRKKKVPLDRGFSLFVTVEICKALQYAHSKRDSQTGKEYHIVHRDISPQNIMLSREGSVKMIDFGIAKGTHQENKSTIGSLKGKIKYMSPEQAQGKPVDHRSDLFSLSLVLYEMLVGKSFFTGNSEMDLYQAVTQYKNPLGDFKKLALPADLRAVIEKGLAPEPKDRFQSAWEIQVALQKILYRDYPDFGEKEIRELVKQSAPRKKAA